MIERVRSVTKKVFKQELKPCGIMILGFTPTCAPPCLPLNVG